MRRKAIQVIAASLLATAAQQGAMASPSGPMTVQAGSLPLVRKVDERFQSYQIGFSHLTGGETWKAYDALPSAPAKDVSQVREARSATDLASPRLRMLTAALAPFYLRYSGTTANSVYFQDDDRPMLDKPPEGYKVVLTRRRWKDALDFAKATNATVVTTFTVSEGVRDSAHNWTDKMAAPWMAYTRSIGGAVYAAELYNEPNAPDYPHTPKGVEASRFARDFAAFRAAMAKDSPRVRIAGPGNATLGIEGGGIIMKPTPEEYASADPRPRFDIFSYHFYPVIAQRCVPASSPQSITADRALDEEFLARPDRQFQEIKGLRDRYAPGAPIWLTETGGAACGGLVWQPTFLDTFRYLDTHARLAKQGLDAIFTHALISGSNGVIDEKTLEPNASYWAAVLWRRLMGTGVLDAGQSRPGVHLYAHCQRGGSGGVTLLALNLTDKAQSLDVSGPAQLYSLTAPEMQSRTVQLNGRPLSLTARGRMPEIAPVRVRGGRVTLAPTSNNFIVIPEARNPACGR